MKKKTIYKSDLYHGDALEVLPTLDTEFDAAIVDPPYSTALPKEAELIQPLTIRSTMPPLSFSLRISFVFPSGMVSSLFR